MAATAIAPAEATVTEMQPGASSPPDWPVWQRVVFRFFFVYLLLQVAPWDWFGVMPGMGFVLRNYQRVVDWAVTESNARVFHVRETLVPVNESGDTSWAWAQMWPARSGRACTMSGTTW